MDFQIKLILPAGLRTNTGGVLVGQSRQNNDRQVFQTVHGILFLQGMDGTGEPQLLYKAVQASILGMEVLRVRHVPDPNQHIQAQQCGAASHERAQNTVGRGILHLVRKGKNGGLRQNKRDEGGAKIDGLDGMEQRCGAFPVLDHALQIETNLGKNHGGDGDGQNFSIINRLWMKIKPDGISCCYTSANTEVIGSEEYFDDMIAKGAKFAWFFTYMPCGQGAVPALLATAEQREFMYHQIRKFRQTKPIFTLDFWNDGEYVDGCIAGGRRYCHINANGDVEPCAFIHYSDSNIREKTLLEVLQSPLFMAYHDNQPWNENHLRPCPVLDNPGRLTAVVEATGAHSTEMEAPDSVRDFSDRCVERAAKWAVTADRLWAESGHTCHGSCAGCAAARQQN